MWACGYYYYSLQPWMIAETSNNEILMQLLMIITRGVSNERNFVDASRNLVLKFEIQL